MTDLTHVYVLITVDGTVGAYTTQDHALDAALALGDSSPWIEVCELDEPGHTITPAATEAPYDDVRGGGAPEPQDETPTRQTGTKRRSWISPPSLTIRGESFWAPWDGGDVA